MKTGYTLSSFISAREFSFAIHFYKERKILRIIIWKWFAEIYLYKGNQNDQR